MRPIKHKRHRFRFATFLTALHRFSLSHGGDGNPLPAVVGDTAYHDPTELAEALASDAEDVVAKIPNDSMRRLEMGLTLFAQFASFDGFGGLDCADGCRVEVPDFDADDEEDETPRRRRTRKYLAAVANTVGDESQSFGFTIMLVGEKVVIEATGMSDAGGECELVPLAEPNLLSDAMRRWVRSFATSAKGAAR